MSGSAIGPAGAPARSAVKPRRSAASRSSAVARRPVIAPSRASIPAGSSSTGRGELAARRGPAPRPQRAAVEEAVGAEHRVRPGRGVGGERPREHRVLRRPRDRPEPIERRIVAVGHRRIAGVAAEAHRVAVQVGGVERRAGVVAPRELGGEPVEVGGRDRVRDDREQLGAPQRREIVELDRGARQVEQRERRPVAARGGRLIAHRRGERRRPGPARAGPCPSTPPRSGCRCAGRAARRSRSRPSARGTPAGS